jgi:uncharacterized protein YecT (DUF1311 family)
MRRYGKVLCIACVVVVSRFGALCIGVELPLAWSTEAPTQPPCADPQTQTAINACAEQEYKEADAALNVTYKRLMEKLIPGRKTQLKAAQTAWIKFRDAHCRFDSTPYRGGTMAPTVYYGCITAMTKARTEELQKALGELSAR